MPRMGRIPAAEAMPVEDETRQFIQQVRRTTRRKLTAEEKVRSCWRASGARPGCQTSAAGEGINPNVYYAWLKEFMEAGKTRLAAETVRDATQLEVASIKRDNERLKQLVAELSLEVLVLKKNRHPRVPLRPRHARMNPGEKASLVALVRASPLPRQQVLAQLGLARSSYYDWLRRGEDRTDASRPLRRPP